MGYEQVAKRIANIRLTCKRVENSCLVKLLDISYHKKNEKYRKNQLFFHIPEEKIEEKQCSPIDKQGCC